MSAHDCDFMDEPVCPYCGEEDGTDGIEGSGTTACSSCGEEYRYECDYSVTYTTTCMECDYTEVKEHKGIMYMDCKRCGARKAVDDVVG